MACQGFQAGSVLQVFGVWTRGRLMEKSRAILPAENITREGSLACSMRTSFLGIRLRERENRSLLLPEFIVLPFPINGAQAAYPARVGAIKPRYGLRFSAGENRAQNANVHSDSYAS
jgi:hypothetical protein